MSILIPSKVVDFLGRKEKFCVMTYDIPKDPTPAGLDDLRDLASRIALESILQYYNHISIHVRPGVSKFLLEPLKNANFYSDNNKDILFRLMMSQRGLVATYNDRGEYFKDPEVKHCYENRILHPKKINSDIKGIGYDYGTRFLYDTADMIYIDKGTLYTGLSIDKMVRR
jgi:hypothetical protein